MLSASFAEDGVEYPRGAASWFRLQLHAIAIVVIAADYCWRFVHTAHRRLCNADALFAPHLLVVRSLDNADASIHNRGDAQPL